jgi:hypothetical protein
MAYIGRGTDKLSNIEKLDTITFDGSSSYTLQKNSVNFTPNSANSLQVSIDGVVQAGNFTVSGSTIDFGVAIPATSTNDFIFHYGTGLVTTVADGAITDAKLAASAINSQTAETTVADGDEVLIYDTSASALRKMTKSNFVGNGVAKAWVQFDGTAATVSVDAGYNVSSITDHGGGTYTINFTNAFEDAEYCGVYGNRSISGQFHWIIEDGNTVVRSTTAVRVTIAKHDNSTATDSAVVSAAFFR